MLWASGAAVRPDAARWPQLGVGRRWSWGPHPRMSPHATAGRSWRSAPAHGPRPAPETSSVRCGAPASTPMWWLFAGTPVHSADHACMAPGASQAPRTAGRPWVGHGSAPRAAPARSAAGAAGRGRSRARPPRPPCRGPASGPSGAPPCTRARRPRGPSRACRPCRALMHCAERPSVLRKCEQTCALRYGSSPKHVSESVAGVDKRTRTRYW